MRLLSCCILLGVLDAVPAQVDPAPRPRVGLVLSGGGARGCAHVGVLQVLEELRVPVDVVAGTSMGSIVGGLYAYGYGPARLEAEMTRTGARRPWARLLVDDPPRARQSFRRKREDFTLPVDVGLGWRDGGFRLPKGLRQGQNLDLELRSLVLFAHELQSFDELRLPFRAVAVELRTGAEVVLDRGDLAAAMRASMSLPGIFAPAHVGGRDLLDGGLVNNVPVDVARAMGAEQLIVVDIGTPVERDEVGSALEVSEQMVQILTQQNVDRALSSLEAADVLIRPELGDITSADFERAAESIRLGRQAALAVREKLARLAVSEAEYAAYLRRQRRPAAPPPVIHKLQIDNRSGLGTETLRARIHVQEGRPLDLEHLRFDLDRIHGMGDFESVTFLLRRDAQGRFELWVRATEKSWGPTYLRFGLALSSNLEGRSAFNAIGHINFRELNALGAEWRTELDVGDTSGVATEFYQPLSHDGRFFLAPAFSASSFETRPQATGYLDVRLAQGGLDLGVNLSSWAELRLGAFRAGGDVDVFNVLGVPGFDFDDGGLTAQLEFDLLDDPDFPEWGSSGAAYWKMGHDSLGADQEYQVVGAGGRAFVSFGSNTFGFGANFSTVTDKRLPVYQLPGLGGFSRLSGLQPGDLADQHQGFAALLYRRHVAGTRAEILGFPTYVGGTLEIGNVWPDRDRMLRKWRPAGSVFVGLNTPVGPTYLAYGLAEGGENSVYLFVGRIF